MSIPVMSVANILATKMELSIPHLAETVEDLMRGLVLEKGQRGGMTRLPQHVN